MGIFSNIRGENFELCEKGSGKKIEITRDEMIKIVRAVSFYRDNEADAFQVLKYDDIYMKLDKMLD